MPELDHLIFAAADLDSGVAHIAERTGSTAVPGGPHPGIGTHNALLGFDDVTYFEIIAVDPAQPEPDRPRPFGLDDDRGPRLAGYAVHPSPGETIDDLVALLRQAGDDPGPVRSMSRLRPDGTELSWRLTMTSRPAPAPVPFAIDWGATPSPATALASMGRLVELRVAHPEPAERAVAAVIADAIGSAVAVADGPAELTAIVETPSGRVEIS